MHYWQRSPQNPTGLNPEEIAQETKWQKAVYEDTDAEEGCVVPQLVHSSKGRFFEMGFLHTVSKSQFKGTAIVPGANVTMLTKLLNDEQRDKQVEMDEMMMQGTKDMTVALVSQIDPQSARLGGLQFQRLLLRAISFLQ